MSDVPIRKNIVTFEKEATRINEKILDPERRKYVSRIIIFIFLPLRKILNIVAHLFTGIPDAWQRQRGADDTSALNARLREKYEVDSGREGTQDSQREAIPKDYISEKRIANIPT